MKLALACSYEVIVGGVETYLRSLVLNLIKNKVEVFLIYKYANNKRGILAGLPVRGICLEENKLDKAVDQVIQFEPDYLIDHGIGCPDFICRLVGKIQLAFFAHDYRFTCISGTKRTKFPFAECNRTLSSSCLLRYLPQGCGGINPFAMVKSYLDAKKTIKTIGIYSKIFVVSDRMAEEYVRQGCNPRNVIKIPYFPTKFVPMETKPEVRKQNYRVIFIARLVETKGWLDAVFAIRYASKKIGRPVSLTIIGGGPDEVKVRQICSSDENIRIIGHQSSNVISKELASHDVLIFPSRWPEPFGLVGLESMTQGVPVIGYKTGGISEWLKDGTNGLFANEQFNPTSLGDCLVKILSDDTLWNRLREHCWEYSLGFTIENHVMQLQKNLQVE